MIGDGPMRSQVERLSAQLGIADSLSILGYRHDVADLMRIMDAFVLTSIYEGLPMVLLEALATGVPSVATNAKGTREVIQNGKNGLLANLEDPESIADLVIDILREPLMREEMRLNGLETIQEIYSQQRMRSGYVSLYSEIVQRLKLRRN